MEGPTLNSSIHNHRGSNAVRIWRDDEVAGPWRRQATCTPAPDMQIRNGLAFEGSEVIAENFSVYMQPLEVGESWKEVSHDQSSVFEIKVCVGSSRQATPSKTADPTPRSLFLLSPVAAVHLSFSLFFCFLIFYFSLSFLYFRSIKLQIEFRSGNTNWYPTIVLKAAAAHIEHLRNIYQNICTALKMYSVPVET